MTEDLGFDPGARLWVRHYPTWRCAKIHCYIHNVDEDAGKYYLRCFECQHMYLTKRDLRHDYRQIGRQLDSLLRDRIRALFTRADDIMFCPACSHDF